MTKFKYVKHGVKRKHGIIKGVLPILEQISIMDGVKKVIPAVISYSPNRVVSKPILRFRRETISGFKLLAHSKGSVQEIFVVVEKSKKEKVRKKLMNHFLFIYAKL
ncbi:MAG TPA: hypothetical protein EYP22_07910 [Methanosarcinales archaeon]|nr:hypothetical protein [Methanosarcinales archaeon]